MKIKGCLDYFYYSILKKVILDWDLAKYSPIEYFSDIPIKFRFWMCKGVLEPFMVHSDDVYYKNNLGLFFKHFEQCSDGNLMICTGAKDKEQKDIYTGDIVSLYVNRYQYNTKSEYDKLYKIFAQVSFDIRKQQYKFLLSQTQQKEICKIKGNEQYDRKIDGIYNPEYLFYEHTKDANRFWHYEEMLKNKDKYSDKKIEEAYDRAKQWEEQDGCLVEGNIYENKELLD